MLRTPSSVTRLARFFATHPLTRDAQLAAWFRFARWQVRSRVHDEIIVPWIGGTRLAVRRGMAGATGNIYAGLHEFADMMFALHFLREDDLFLDVGANIGSFTILASGVRHAKTWCFEPDQETARALRRNIEINDLADRVVVHEIALGEADGTINFTRGLDTMNRIATVDDTDVRSVSVRRLDTVVGTARPIMLKMDVEGFEGTVMKGAPLLVANDSLKAIELEGVPTELDRTLREAGFVVAYYDPMRRDLNRAPHSGAARSNTLYVRDWDFVAARLESGPTVRVLGKSI